MNVYLGYYKNMVNRFKSETQYGAQLKAIEFYKPPKSKKHLVHVALVELAGGVEYIHTAYN